MAEFWQHVIDASLPVLKICLLGSVGAVMARTGILDQHGRKTLSKLIYCLFTPALTFTKLAPVLSAQHLVLWLPLVINMFVSVAAGLLLGGLLLGLVRPPAALRRHVVVATALGNAGNLPLVLVAALIRETGGKLFAGQVLSEDLAIAYVAMGIWAATTTHFTIGTQLLKLTPQQQQQQQQQQCHKGSEQQQLLLWQSPDAEMQDQPGAANAGSSSSSSDAGAACVVELSAVGGHCSQGDQQQQQHVTQARDTSSACACALCGSENPEQAQANPAAAWRCRICGVVNNPLTPLGPHQQQQKQQQQDVSNQQCGRQHSTQHPKVEEHVRLLDPKAGLSNNNSSSWQQQHSHDVKQHPATCDGSSVARVGIRRGLGKLRQLSLDLASQLLSPPMLGCLLAVMVGLIPPVRQQLFDQDGQLLMFTDCIAMFGDCCIPCLLLMLGATLSKGPGKACPPVRVVVGVAAARLLVLPVMGTCWLVLGKVMGWYSAPDKIFLLVMMIQNAVPTALNVHTLATLHGNREEEMAAMLFWQYLAACVTLPAALTTFLWLLHAPLLMSTA